MVALVAMLAFEALAVATAMPSVAAALDGTALYGVAFAAPLATGVVGMVLAGPWADRRGPAGPLVWGVALFALGLVLAGTSGSMLAVALSRGVQGVGTGMATVAMYVVVGRLYPEAARPKVFAAFSAAWVLPGLVGPALAGAIVQGVGWRWVFLAVPVLVVPALALLRPALVVSGREAPPPDETAAPDVRGRAARAVAAATGVAVLAWGGQRPDAVGVTAMAGAAALLLVVVPPLLPAGTLRARRGLPSVVAVRGLVGGAFAGAEAFVPLLLVRERGFGPAAAGTVLTVATLSWFAGSALRGSRRLRVRSSVLLLAGGGALGLGIAAVASVVQPGVPAAVALLGWGLAGFGMGLAYPTLSLLTLELAPAGEQGSASAALQLADALGGAVALAVGGSIFAALDAAPSAYLACLLLPALAGLLAAVVAPRTVASRSG